MDLTSPAHAVKMREEIGHTVVVETLLEVVTETPQEVVTETLLKVVPETLLEAVTDTEMTAEVAETVVDELLDAQTDLTAGDVLTIEMTNTVLVQSRHTRTPWDMR